MQDRINQNADLPRLKIRKKGTTEPNVGYIALNFFFALQILKIAYKTLTALIGQHGSSEGSQVSLELREHSRNKFNIGKASLFLAFHIFILSRNILTFMQSPKR